MTTRSKGSDRSADIAARLTITMAGPEVIDLRTNSEELGTVITPEQALAFRPQLDDPTRLTSGELHPRYAEWMYSHSWAELHPLSAYLYQDKHLQRVSDEQGYFDRKRINRVLRASGSKYWLLDGPLPTKTKIPCLAELLDAPIDEVASVVQAERQARAEYQSVLARCRSMPYQLLTYDQVRAGLPCPGCGRPWVGPQDAIDDDDELWRAQHGACHAGRNGYTDAPLHCLRCCGTPPPSPEQLAIVRDSPSRSPPVKSAIGNWQRQRPPRPSAADKSSERSREPTGSKS